MDQMLIRADARRIPIADGSVHCCACSPPFYGLRNYQVPDQIGLESSPAEFVQAMRAVGREVWRVLHPTGSWWLNLGDSFASGNRGSNTGHSHGVGACKRAGAAGQYNAQANRNLDSSLGYKPKDLMLIPERVVLALQSDGWYVRAKPPWIKPSPMPESTSDRPNVAHESVFLLTKSSKYYFDMEAVRVPSASSTLGRDTYTRVTSGKDGGYSVVHDHETPSNPNGRHLRTNDFFTAGLDAAIAYHEDAAAHLRHVRDDGGLACGDGDPLAFWVAAQGFNGAHFATWPERLVKLMILAGTSEAGCCAACGKPWERVVERKASTEGRPNWAGCEHSKAGASRNGGFYDAEVKTTGFRPACPCDAGDAVPCTVMDCFGGAQTTGVVAAALGRNYVGLDLNPEYLTMGRARVAESLRPVSRLDGAVRPVRPLAGQLDLF